MEAITGKTYDPASGQSRTLQMPAVITTLVLRQGGGAVVTLRTGIHFLDLDSGALEPIHPLPDPPPHVFNDGKVDQRGSPWTRPGNLVGNGYFTLTEWKPNQYIRGTKSTTYWDRDNVKLNEVPYKGTGPALTDLMGGQVHLSFATSGSVARRRALLILRMQAPERDIKRQSRFR